MSTISNESISRKEKRQIEKCDMTINNSSDCKRKDNTLSYTVTYEPDNSLKRGYLSLFSEIANDIISNSWLTYQLFRRDFLAAYKQTLIGALWSVIIPLMSLGMFVLLNHAGIFVVGITNVPYPIYAMLGVAFWQVFATGIQASSNTLVNAGSMIVKINCSKKSLVIAAIGQPMVSFIIQLIFIGALFVAYRLTPHLSVIFIPFLLLPIVALVLALGFILSLINGIVRDVGNALSALLGFLMLLTPVFYPKPSSGILAYISTLNPLFYLTSLPRDLVLSGTSTEWTGYIVSVCLSGVALVASILIFHLTETRIAERI